MRARTPRQRRAEAKTASASRDPAGRAAPRPLLQRLATWLLYLAGGLVLLAWEGLPFPYGPMLCVLIPLPWVALALTALRPDLFTLTWDDKDVPYESLMLLLVLPGLAMAWLSLGEVQMEHWWTAWLLAVLYALAGGVLMALLAAVCCKRLRASKPAIGALALFMVPYGGALALAANVWLDAGGAHAYRLPIASVRDEHVYKRTHRYFLGLGAWGSHRSSDEYEVDDSLFRGKKKGDIVCVLVYPGLLRMAWYEVNNCPD